MTDLTEKEIEIILAHLKKEWDYHASELQALDGLIQSLERARTPNLPKQMKVICAFCGTDNVLTGSNREPVDICANCLVTHARPSKVTLP